MPDSAHTIPGGGEVVGVGSGGTIAVMIMINMQYYYYTMKKIAKNAILNNNVAVDIVL